MFSKRATGPLSRSAHPAIVAHHRVYRHSVYRYPQAFSACFGLSTFFSTTSTDEFCQNQLITQTLCSHMDSLDMFRQLPQPPIDASILCTNNTNKPSPKSANPLTPVSDRERIWMATDIDPSSHFALAVHHRSMPIILPLRLEPLWRIRPWWYW